VKHLRNTNGTFAHGSTHLVKHGKAKTKIYGIWNGMKSRCQNPNNSAYKDYGGRGIKVCDSWNEFSNFYADMGEPKNGMTLERINNDENYCKENCTWANRSEQSLNRRNAVKLTIGDKTLSVSQWAEQSPVSSKTIYARIKNGWPHDLAVFSKQVSRLGIPRGKMLRDFQTTT
jgi:hypothetical protein